MKDIARADIKPAFAVRNVPVALATDENYLPYLKVAINSAIANSPGSNLDIIVLHAGIPEDAILDFTAGYASVGNASVRFVDISDELETSGLSDYRQTARLPLSACYRLLLPRVLAAYGKVVYLDVDVAVCRDLGELYATDLGDCYFAAALDVVHTTRPEYLSWAAKWGFTEWDGYVNTGVLVMNLERFRRESVFDRLLPVVLEASKWLCDQDALNFVCKGAIAPLDPRWNMQLGDYCLEKQIALTGDEMWVAHFTGGEKPWNCPVHRFSHLWWRHVDDLGRSIALWRRAFDVADTVVSQGEGIAVSVIVPIYNAESYLVQMLVSLAAQTLRNIEVICVDDGSTDGSGAICERFAAVDTRFKILHQTNSGAAVARNRGIGEARGRWLFFADADDFCRPDMLAAMVARGDALDAEIVAAGYFVKDQRIELLHLPPMSMQMPKSQDGVATGIINRETPGVNIFSSFGFAPWNKLFRRDFVTRRGLAFHQTPSCDDVFFVCANLVSAERVAIVDANYYYYRSFLATSQMGHVDKYPTSFLKALKDVHDFIERYDSNIRERFFKTAVCVCFDALMNLRSLDGMCAAYAAMRSGGINSLSYPDLDISNTDFGDYNALFRIVSQGSDLMDVLHEYAHSTKIKNIMRTYERDVARRQRDQFQRERDEARKLRDKFQAERDAARGLRDQFLRERDEARMMRNRFLTERDEARKKRDDLKAELKASKSLARDIQEKLAEVEKALMRAR